jgi:hypothetical protein
MKSEKCWNAWMLATVAADCCCPSKGHWYVVDVGKSVSFGIPICQNWLAKDGTIPEIRRFFALHCMPQISVFLPPMLASKYL